MTQSASNPSISDSPDKTEQAPAAGAGGAPVSLPSPADSLPAEQTAIDMLQDGSDSRRPAKASRYLPDFLPPLRAKSVVLATAFMQPEGRILRFLCWFILAPTAAVFIYLAIFASNIYISEAKFAVRSQNAPSSLDFPASLLRFAGGTSGSDAYIVYNYVYSQDMLAKLDAKLHIRDHYSSRDHDPWYRLWQKSTQDELATYWKWAVTTAFDPDTGILSLKVKAFTPHMAQEICRGVLENSEALVNAMNDRAREDAMSQARLEVARAEERIVAAQAAMKKYQDQTMILDPQAVAGGLYAVVNTLEGEVAKTKAELAEARTFIKADAPKVITLQNRLKVLEKQLKAEQQRLAGAMEKDQSLSALVSEFQRLALEEEFARKQLTSAMASLEAARIQAESKTLYVESFEKPTLPDESLYPRPVLFSFIFMVAALLILGMSTLIIAAVREHAGF